jgi:hypothetical protein
VEDEAAGLVDDDEREDSPVSWSIGERGWPGEMLTCLPTHAPQVCAQ